MPASEVAWWTAARGDCPVLGTAIHDGHQVDEALAARMAIGAEERLREEDPFTGQMIGGLTNRVIVHPSRFYVDLNRAPAEAIYLDPEQSWGLEVWKERPGKETIKRLLHFHGEYYRMLETTLAGLERRFGRFVVLDIHSYNHRRDGPDAAPVDPEAAPEVNIGTFSMDREKWAHIVEPFMAAIRAYDFDGRHLDVRENIAFQGKGEQTRFIHERFPDSGCAIAVEFKKFFMDEWTGKPIDEALSRIRELIASIVPLLERVLKEGQ